MRVNKFVAQASGLSRRAADAAIEQGRVLVNDQRPSPGQDITNTDNVVLDSKRLQLRTTQTIIVNKPVGYVVSRDGQGDKTIYDMLPTELHHLKPVGRLDKFSSGLLLLTNDGNLAQQLAHPSNHKAKIYEITLAQDLQPLHRQMISDHGVQLEDGPSQLQLERLHDGNDRQWRITMHEGRNRQIRRTFLALGYGITNLHRTQLGDFTLSGLQLGAYRQSDS